MTPRDPYAAAGVDTGAGDRAVDMMKAAVAATHGPQVIGGLGGFAGLFDLSEACTMRRPLMATSTDGVGTKLAIAQALDIHDTVGLDLVGMVVDDIVAVGARPLFLTDYIACGRVEPSRIAALVGGIARGCAETGVALIGGETAEHPGVMELDEYDLAGAAVGLVEADACLGAPRVRDGDVALAIASDGLHSNGYSLVRHILGEAGVGYGAVAADLGSSTTWGEALLTPTRLYTAALLPLVPRLHALAHVTGGGLAANLARVLPPGARADLDRATWSPPPIFRALAALGGLDLAAVEGTWNLGIGFVAVLPPADVAAVTATLPFAAWPLGEIRCDPDPQAAADGKGFVSGTKGVAGGAVRLVGTYSS